MDTFFYIILFIIGTVFGSFYTLAVYRIPKKQDITHTHSYCPNCEKKLGVLDLIPILSYIFLGGKCRYCRNKIRARYLMLEILSGTLFLALGYLLNLKIDNLNLINIATYSFISLYITFIVLISGIDKENKRIEKSVLVYGIVISIMYMLYLCIVEKANIYRYGIYLIIYIIILIFDTMTLKKIAKDNYTIGIIMMIITMTVFTGEHITANAIIFTLLLIALNISINKMKKTKKTDKQRAKEVPIGFYLGISNIVTLIFALIQNHIKVI